jgi:hypothetical protein
LPIILLRLATLQTPYSVMVCILHISYIEMFSQCTFNVCTVIRMTHTSVDKVISFYLHLNF